jgi:hypothetical protein
MRKTTVEMPVLASVAVTRGMLGAGLALLLGDRLTVKQRKVIGWGLFLTGVVTTGPLVLRVMAGRHT